MSCGWLRKSFRLSGRSYTPKRRHWIGACREASKAESFVERLAEECSVLCGDLQRREAMVVHRDGVIAELKDEACTLWASGWLAFQRRAVKAFQGLDFDFLVPNSDEEEAEESVSEDEADPGVSSDTSSSAPLPGEVEVPAGAGSPLPPAGASPFNLHGLEARTTEAARSSPSNI